MQAAESGIWNSQTPLPGRARSRRHPGRVDHARRSVFSCARFRTSPLESSSFASVSNSCSAGPWFSTPRRLRSARGSAREANSRMALDLLERLPNFRRQAGEFQSAFDRIEQIFGFVQPARKSFERAIRLQNAFSQPAQRMFGKAQVIA